MYYYERKYKKLKDVISSIIGFFQVINIITIYLNVVYNSFVILLDSEELLYSLINTEKRIF